MKNGTYKVEAFGPSYPNGLITYHDSFKSAKMAFDLRQKEKAFTWGNLINKTRNGQLRYVKHFEITL